MKLKNKSALSNPFDTDEQAGAPIKTEGFYLNYTVKSI